jgi:3-hydroxyisobutyrate dehydrogenase
VYRLGEAPGIGTSVKMINQLLAGVHIAAAAEAMALAARAGLDPQVVFEVISNSAGASWMFTNRVPHMLTGDYTPQSALDIFVKDLGIVLDTGNALRFPLPVAAAAHQMFLMGAAAGLGRHDDAAVVKVYEQVAGIQVARPSENA